MKYWLIAVSSLVRSWLRSVSTSSLPFMIVLALAGRPYRHEIGGTIATAAIRALGEQAIAQLLDTGAAAGSGTATLADLFDRACAVVDDRVDIAIRSGMAHADDHRK